jgi:protein TonB
VSFEAFLKQDEGADWRRRWRVVTLGGSLALHAALVAFVVARSFWQVDELQAPTVAITLISHPPAPPPPPPPAAAARAEPPAPVKPRARRLPVPKLTQPQERPVDEAPATDDAVVKQEAPQTDAGGGDLTIGVMGGVAAAVMTAVVMPERAAEPSPVMLPPNVGGGQRLSDVGDPRFRPSLPRAMKLAGATVWGLFRICVDARGQVKEVKVLKSADPLVDGEWCETIRRWSYRPYQLGGRPVPFCHPARVEVRAEP